MYGLKKNILLLVRLLLQEVLQLREELFNALLEAGETDDLLTTRSFCWVLTQEHLQQDCQVLGVVFWYPIVTSLHNFLVEQVHVLSLEWHRQSQDLI